MTIIAWIILIIVFLLLLPDAIGCLLYLAFYGFIFWIILWALNTVTGGWVTDMCNHLFG